jgi:DNA repair protein RecO (recombination protein O)
LRSDPARYALASFLTEMLDRHSPEGVTGTDAERLFVYATESLALLESVRPTSTLRLLLELRGFDALGLRPELGRCVRCGRVPSQAVALDHQVHFHVPDGGIVCSACALRIDDLVPVEFGTLRLLQSGLESRSESLAEIRLDACALAQAAHLVFRFQRFHVGIELRSERFLEEMLPIGTVGIA